MLRLVQMGLSPMKHCVDRQFYSTEGATIAVITEFQSKHHRIVATKRKSNHMLLLTICTDYQYAISKASQLIGKIKEKYAINSSLNNAQNHGRRTNVSVLIVTKKVIHCISLCKLCSH